jgi:DNA-binding XRE family transcriptional regulator
MRSARARLGLTQAQLAERLGVHWTTIAAKENGRSEIRPSDRLALAALLSEHQAQQGAA